jgi:hypothetical protein
LSSDAHIVFIFEIWLKKLINEANLLLLRSSIVRGIFIWFVDDDCVRKSLQDLPVRLVESLYSSVQQKLFPLLLLNIVEDHSLEECEHEHAMIDADWHSLSPVGLQVDGDVEASGEDQRRCWDDPWSMEHEGKRWKNSDGDVDIDGKLVLGRLDYDEGNSHTKSNSEDWLCQFDESVSLSLYKVGKENEENDEDESRHCPLHLLSSCCMQGNHNKKWESQK